MNWFYAKDGQPTGPVDEEEFARLVASGAVSDDTLVWRSGLPEWKPYAVIRLATPPSLPVAAPLANVTTEAEPIAPARRSPAPSEIADALPYAGFWIRVGASLLDSLILTPVFTVLYLAFIVASPDFLANDAAGAHVRILFEFAVLTIAGGFQTFFLGRFGATPGKMICNLRLVSSNGSRVSYGRALGRYFCNSVFCGFGFITVPFNRQRCALHDFVCETRVIHTD